MSSLLLQRRVAVIGGGPAGLVAYKRLVDAGITPTLFSKSIGGMWSVKANPFWPTMKTNLSKFTCRFSDHHWPPNASMFPSQSEMDLYLSSYSTKYVKPENAIIGCTVTHINACENGQYRIKWTDSSNEALSGMFDDVVVTTGFFSKPIHTELTGFKGRIIHSSQYTDPAEFAGRNVVVAGAAFSAVEIAADVATTASSVRNVVSRPTWVIPRFLPLHNDKPNTPFLPVDLLFYQLNPEKDTMALRRETLFKEDADRRRTNGYMAALLGDSKHDVMNQLRAQEAVQVASAGYDYTVPSVQASISDNYSNMVKAKHIEIVQGYVHSVGENSVSLVSQRQAANTSAEPSTVLENVDDLILCTGFTPALDFLDPALLETIGFNRADSLQPPLLLHRDVLHPALPGLYFVGMYRGPYFAGVELQASAVAAYISGAVTTPTEQAMHEGLATSLKIRQQVPRPQFPHADYVGMCIDWMRDLNVPLRSAPELATDASLSGLPESGDYIFSPDLLAHASDSSGGRSSIAQAITDCNNGKYLSQTIFRALQGEWTFERALISKLDSSPSGTVVGKISLLRADRASSDLVYVEKGKFTTTRGMTLDVNGSQYVYALNEEEDCIDIFFTDKETGRIKERIFVSLRVVGRDAEGWIAVGEPHLCGKDTYVVRFRMAFQGLALRSVEIQIDVKGPFKDYQSTTVLTPQ